MFFSFEFGSYRVRTAAVLAVLFLAALSASAQMSVIGSVSPRQVSYIGTATFSATASGGDPATTRYAFFRRRPGGTWIPDINAPAWQSGSSYNWNPTLSDVGVWETYVWVKDGNTPPTMNTYGYAAGHNSQPIEVFGPPTAPGPTTASCDYSAGGECWVTGDFTVSVSPASGGLGSLVYQICRSNDTTGWGGCDVNLTLNGGTSITVSGSHLPADGYQRAYYFMARDSAGALGGWNSPKFVRVDRYAPSVGASNASDLWYSSRTATISASDGGSGLQEVRYSWNSSPNSSCTTGTPASSGTTLTAPAGDNLLYVCGRDNTGRVGQWSGRYRISPMSVTGSVSPSRGSYLGTFTSTATASGGTPATTSFAFFRRRIGGPWIPAVTAPVWQGNVHTWQPALADVGTWETYIWVKDGNTPSNANTYGYAAGVNTGLIEVVGPPTKPGATTVACAWSTADDCWVLGDFTASVTASTGGMGSLVYQICRSNDTTGFGGCDVNLTLTGGTSILVSGTHLPADGYRRAFYFQAKDSAGALSGWNTQRYVRVDRYGPAVSATNASDLWFPSRAATVSASDAQSGLFEVRYSWNSALNAACTDGTATSSGATLTAPVGDNVLYLCARDNVARVTQWNGRYRVAAQPTLTGCSASPARGSYANPFTFTATSSGGDPATLRYAFFRRRPGGTWIPAVTAPTWQASNVSSWTAAQSDAGMWEIYVWVKDANTPASQNTYGYAAGCNAGLIEVVGPPTVPGATAVSCTYTAPNGDCWVTGDFTASATASTGGMGGIVYQICRSNDTAGTGGCDVNLTLTGGTSIVVSGTHLPADGSRRAYYFQARDSAGGQSGWNTPKYVRIDRYAPVVTATNASDTYFSSRIATVSVSDTGTGGSGIQAFRYSWNTALDAGCTTGTATSTGAALTAPAGDNLLYLCAKDNTGRVGQWSGRYRVSPLGLTGTISPARASYLGSFTYTATATGGTPSTIQYAFFRRKGTGPWIPDVNTPNWQAGNTFTWQPAQADVGTWETYIWVKDADTPATMNTYGYAAGFNTGLIEVVGPPTKPGATTVSCAWSTAEDCWVLGDFTISAAASTGGMGSLVYQICRSNDTTGFGGCDVNLTLTGGTSIAVSGTHLPADGYRRSYWFQAKDTAGALSGWNTPRYVRVDRNAPTVSATNASDTWFSSRTATVSASDATGTAGANSGLFEVRYSWNSALNAACTNGTATSSGATLTVPAGDNMLYLCARDNVARVTQWSGRYRVAAPLTLVVTPTPAKSSYLSTISWTATATGGVPGTIQYAFVRRRPGGSWIPALSALEWKTTNPLTWTPTLADVGVWEFLFVAKDSLTASTANTYGYAVSYNPGNGEVVGPPTKPGATTVSCAYSVADDCWVQGDFTASVAASTGGMGTLVYQICRSVDSAGGFAGCDVNLTLTGGTSIAVSGTHLPADGFRRAYYFQAKDTAGAMSGWNTPRYVRVDRHAPTVSATNASDLWFPSRTATVSASDTGSGLVALRHSWNTVLDAGCAGGTVVASGTELTVPEGDNVLYLCAKDKVGRITQWNGRYRVENLPEPEVTSVTPFLIHQGNEMILTVTGANLQGATVYVATEPHEEDDPSTIPDAFPTAELLSINAAGTSLTVRIDARAAGVEGFHNLAVETRGGLTAGQFRVVGAAPAVDFMSPSQPVQGSIHILMLGGANLEGADIVPSHPGIKVIDLDNSNDESVMGLLYVSPDVPTGPYQIRVERPGGAFLAMSIDVVGGASAASLTTTQLDAPGRSQQADVPEILLQEPINLQDSGFRQLIAPLAMEGIESLASPSTAACFAWWESAGWQRSYILLALTNLLGGEPVTRDVLNRLAPGERLNFNSLTTAAHIYIRYDFLVRVCYMGNTRWVATLAVCVSGGASYMVPLVGGHRIEFDLCAGNGGTKFELTAEGGITKQEWSTSSPCITVDDADPESQSGSRSGSIGMHCCTPTDINVRMTGSAFQQNFDVGGKLMSVQQTDCIDPDTCTKKIEWQYVKADGTLGPVMSGPVNLFTTPEQRTANVSVSFTPGGGTFPEGTFWSGGDAVVDISGESASAAVARVTLTAGPDPGTTTVTTPLYRREEIECRADVPVTVSTVEVQINSTPDRNDDMVEVRSPISPDKRRKIKARVRLPDTAPNDVTVVLTNPDGRLRFPGPADTTKTLILPRNRDWVEFEISGEIKSDAKDDARVEVHQDTAEGLLLGHQTVTVFYFESTMTVIQGGSYEWNAGHVYAPLNGPAVTFEASATVQPANLDCTAAPLKDIRIGIMQNARSQRRSLIVDKPTINCLPGIPSGTRVTVPEIRLMSKSVLQFVNDSTSQSAPLYSQETGALASPVNCGGGPAVSRDTPHMNFATIDIPPKPPSLAGVAEGTLTYEVRRVTFDDTFRIWSVSFDVVTQEAIPLRERDWNLRVDSDATTPQQATVSPLDFAPTNVPVEAPPFFNDVLASAGWAINNGVTNTTVTCK